MENSLALAECTLTPIGCMSTPLQLGQEDIFNSVQNSVALAVPYRLIHIFVSNFLSHNLTLFVVIFSFILFYLVNDLAC